MVPGLHAHTRGSVLPGALSCTSYASYSQSSCWEKPLLVGSKELWRQGCWDEELEEEKDLNTPHTQKNVYVQRFGERDGEGGSEEDAACSSGACQPVVGRAGWRKSPLGSVVPILHGPLATFL